jgi:phytoene synthase
MLEKYSYRGSDIYYVLRQVPYKKRQSYQALHALASELNHISEHYHEATIATQKLHWWSDEVQRFFVGQASHPFLKALEPARSILSKTALLALIEANLLSVQTHIFETRAELLQHYQHLGGIQFDLKAQILGRHMPPLLPHQLGMQAEILRHLIHFKPNMDRQHLYFALEDFRQYQIDPQPILQGKNSADLQPLFAAYFALAQQDQPSIPRLLKPLYLEWKLKHRQVGKIAKQSWQWQRFQVELTPLQKLILTLWP